MDPQVSHDPEFSFDDSREKNFILPEIWLVKSPNPKLSSDDNFLNFKMSALEV